MLRVFAEVRVRRDLTDRVLGTVQLSGVFVPRWGRHPVPDPHIHMHIPLSVRALRDGPRHVMHTERTLNGREFR